MRYDYELFNEIIEAYSNALTLLDDYDHAALTKSKGTTPACQLEYNECREFINKMRFVNDSNVFGVEKEVGKLDGILKAIEQTAFGEEVYKSIEEKAANLLYFVIKDHPFVDGCKRIAAGLFVLYLGKNYKMLNENLTISNGTLASVTLLIAESKPEEKDIMINVIMRILLQRL